MPIRGTQEFENAVLQHVLTMDDKNENQETPVSDKKEVTIEEKLVN